MTRPLARAVAFADSLGMSVPIMLAPMAGACPVSLSIEVAKAGGMGAAGVLFMSPAEINEWVASFRAAGGGALQLNTWMPQPAPRRDAAHEGRLCDFLGSWGPPVDPAAGDAPPHDFDGQCEAMLAARPTAISSIMGLFAPNYVERMKNAGVKWFATATTVREAIAARDAGADAIIAQGAEAGGHRGAFNAADAESALVGLFALLPAIVDAVDIPVIASGGIADPRALASALALGGSAAMIGTGFLRCPEAGVPPAWADALAKAAPEDTLVTRAFSGRPGRALATEYARAAAAQGAPTPAPYPVQRGLTAAMRAQAAKANDVDRMQAWAGQAARLAAARPAADVVSAIWLGARDLLA